MAVVTKMIKLHIFTLQLIQIPMIAHKKFMGNAMIWIRLLLILCLVLGFIIRGS
ncbi:hypothetical protein BGW80DRAFT_1351418 [Lactifluus volemus]|nr:hypothetical protein BGW80DRAFT_1351418 [Lactifluus volemus]